MPNIFHKAETDALIERLQTLTPNTKARWGKMDAAQMLAHCNVVYEMSLEHKHKKPNAFVKFMLKTFAKSTVVGSKPYKRGGQTAPQMLITGNKNFVLEKQRLLDYLTKTQTLGASYFHQKESFSFGKLSSEEWSNMFKKHLEHHLAQFNV